MAFKNRKKQYYWVYILYCVNHSYYTGYTNNLIKRYHEHVKGTAKCKFTRSFKPIKLVHYWLLNDQSQAMKLECWIKKLSRSEKEILINHPQQIPQLFSNFIISY